MLLPIRWTVDLVKPKGGNNDVNGNVDRCSYGTKATESLGMTDDETEFEKNRRNVDGLQHDKDGLQNEYKVSMCPPLVPIHATDKIKDHKTPQTYG